jgi:endonuclease YncB( thermonuclease family)
VPLLRRLLPPLAIALALAAIILGARFTAVPASEVVHPVSDLLVIDGDTVEIAGEIVRLFGIEAPELGQRCLHDGVWTHCGLDAAFELKKLVGISQSPLKCSPVASRDSTTTAICMLGKTDIAHALLFGGYVRATDDASPAYKEAEAEASRAGLGLWHSQFVDPLDWRAGERLPGYSDATQDPCPIKAIITGNGQHVFYVPTDPDYNAVEVDPMKGDQRYCSVDLAHAAGWQHALGGTGVPR